MHFSTFRERRRLSGPLIHAAAHCNSDGIACDIHINNKKSWGITLLQSGANRERVVIIAELGWLLSTTSAPVPYLQNSIRNKPPLAGLRGEKAPPSTKMGREGEPGSLESCWPKGFAARGYAETPTKPSPTALPHLNSLGCRISQPAAPLKQGKAKPAEKAQADQGMP